jgi:hypothetical protein
VEYPIIDPALHYTCYDIEEEPFAALFTGADQFGTGPYGLEHADLLCTPAFKTVLAIPALSTQGVIAFLLFGTGVLFVIYRRRSRRMSG